MSDAFNNGLVCPKCDHPQVYIEHDGRKYSYYCSSCHFTGMKSYWNWVAEFWFLLGVGHAN